MKLNILALVTMAVTASASVLPTGLFTNSTGAADMVVKVAYHHAAADATITRDLNVEEKHPSFCTFVHYPFTVGWEIKGRNWDHHKVGAKGQGLLDNLKSCGPVFNWGFDYLPHNKDYDFRATGNSAFGTHKGCFADAIKAVGGDASDPMFTTCANFAVLPF